MSRQRTGRRKRSRWFRRLLWGLAGLMIVGLPTTWFLPSIVAGTSMRQQVLPLVLPDYPGEFTVASASLGWNSPVELYGVEATDASGEQLLTAEAVRTEKTLLSLLTARRHPGTITIDKPHAMIRLREDGSNIEDAFAPLLVSKLDAKPTVFTLKLTRGTADVLSPAGTLTKLADVDAAVVVPSPGKPLGVRASGTTSLAERHGAFDADLTWHDGERQAAGVLEATRLPLESIDPVLRRFLPGGRIAGALTCKLDWQIDSSADADALAEFTGTCSGQDVLFSDSNLIGGDTLRLTEASYSGSTSITADQITFDKLAFTSSLGHVEAHGVCPVSPLREQNWGAVWSQLNRRPLSVRANLDVAALARSLPATLRIREDVQVTRGTLSIIVQPKVGPVGPTGPAAGGNSPSAPGEPQVQPGRPDLLVSLTASDLRATSQGRQIDWSQPIQFSMTLQDRAGQPQVAAMSCRSQHVVANVGPKDGGFEITAQADLGGLASQLDQVVELGELQLAGTATLRAFVTRTPQQRLAASGAASLQAFRLKLPGGQPWSEDRLNLVGQASGEWPAGEAATVHQGQIQLTSGEDTLIAELLQPVQVVNPAATSWPAQIELRGDLSRWHSRLRPFLPSTDWQVAGSINASARGAFSARAVSIDSSDVQISNLDLLGPSRRISHAQAQMQVAGLWDIVQWRGTAQVVTAATPSWSVRGEGVAVQLPPEGPPSASGEFAFRSDLARTLADLREPTTVPNYDLSGVAVGTLSLKQTDGKTAASWSAEVENFSITTAAEPPQGVVRPINAPAGPQQVVLWLEPKLALQGSLSYSPADGTLHLSQCDAAGSAGQLKTTGRIVGLNTSPGIDLSATSTYDLEKLSGQLGPWLGEQIQLAGQRNGTFTIQGPLPKVGPVGPTGPAARTDQLAVHGPHGAPAKPSGVIVSPELTASATAGWQAANIYGLGVGETDVSAALKNSLVQIGPLDLPIGEGRLTAKPWIYLDRQPNVLAFEEGPLLHAVHLSPQMCHTWLKYVAPWVADATRCEGRISANLTAAQMPLGSPSQMEAAGSLTIHGAQVMTGPLADQYVALARQIENLLAGRLRRGDGGSVSLVQLPQQNVDVQVTAGRVYHRGLTMQIGRVGVQTTGSVGMDQSLDLIAAVRIDESWVAGKPVLASLAGQTIQVPVTGTVKRPRLDRSGLDDLSRQLLRGAATNLLQGEVNKLLDGLLPSAP